MQITQVASLEGHEDRAWAVAWSPKEPLLASCSSDKSVRIYSFSVEGNFTLDTALSSAHPRTVRALAFSADGKTLATGSFDASVGLWRRGRDLDFGDDDNDSGYSGPEMDHRPEFRTELRDGDVDPDAWEQLEPLEGHESECKSVAWSHDGAFLATCGRDKHVWIWEVIDNEFECAAVLMDHTQDVKAVRWSPTSHTLASASYDDTVRLYSRDDYADEWSVTHVLSAPATLWAVAFSPQGTHLAAVGDDGALRIWERVNKDISGKVGDAGIAQQVPGGRMGPWAAAGVRLTDADKYDWVEKYVVDSLHGRTIYSVDWAASGELTNEGGSRALSAEEGDATTGTSLGRIVTGSGDGAIKVIGVFQKSDGNLTHEILSTVNNAHGVYDVNCVTWCRLGEADSKWKRAGEMFASAGDDGTVKVWAVEAS